MATEPKSLSLLAACALAAAASDGCAWCGKALPKRRRTWCSDVCARTFWNNHWWSLARRAAKRRDRYACVRCGARAPKRPARSAFTTTTAYRAAMGAWRALKSSGRMEVNHIQAALGRHRSLSCVHHLVNLETLCVTCHKAQTASQARDRARRRRSSEPSAIA